MAKVNITASPELDPHAPAEIKPIMSYVLAAVDISSLARTYCEQMESIFYAISELASHDGVKEEDLYHRLDWLRQLSSTGQSIAERACEAMFCSHAEHDETLKALKGGAA